MLVQLCLARITEANHSLCCAQGCPGLWLTGSSSEPEQPQDVALMEQSWRCPLPCSPSCPSTALLELAAPARTHWRIARLSINYLLKLEPLS